MAISTKAVESDDTTYGADDAKLVALTLRRDIVAGKIKTALLRAAFDGTTIKPSLATSWLARGKAILTDTAALEASVVT